MEKNKAIFFFFLYSSIIVLHWVSSTKSIFCKKMYQKNIMQREIQKKSLEFDFTEI